MVKSVSSSSPDCRWPRAESRWLRLMAGLLTSVALLCGGRVEATDRPTGSSVVTRSEVIAP